MVYASLPNRNDYRRKVYHYKVNGKLREKGDVINTNSQSYLKSYFSFRQNKVFLYSFRMALFMTPWITGLSHAEIEANNKGNDRTVEGIDISKPNSKMVRTPAGIQETQKLNTVANKTRDAFISWIPNVLWLFRDAWSEGWTALLCLPIKR